MGKSESREEIMLEQTGPNAGVGGHMKMRILGRCISGGNYDKGSHHNERKRYCIRTSGTGPMTPKNMLQ